MTITQLPFVICQNQDCKHEFITTEGKLKYYYINCPKCNYRNENLNAEDGFTVTKRKQ